MNESVGTPTPLDPSARRQLRHLLATIAYRAGRALRGADPDFATLDLGHDARTPVQIVAHMADLFEWSLRIVRGEKGKREPRDLAWEPEVDRFYHHLGLFDQWLASDEALSVDSADKLLQGPLTDSLTHIGQLSTMRRLAGDKLPGESFAAAEIAVGRVGLDQEAPKLRF